MKEKGPALYQLILLVLSLYVLTILIVESFFIQNPEIKKILQFIDFLICLIFLGDFFVQWYAAPNKKAYLKWGWIDFISSVPVLDPLRWGRLARVVRIVRFLRAIRSMRILWGLLVESKVQSLTLVVFIISFLVFTLSAGFILEFERSYESEINTAEAALWWAFLNIMNAKTSLDQAKSPEGLITTIILNKAGLLLFAYFNALIIAWLINHRQNGMAR
jgi:voltage-gated potassium channel